MAMEFPSLPFPSLRVAPSFVFVFVFVSFLPLHGSCPIRTQCHICHIWPGGMIWHSYVALRLVMFVQRANGDVPCGHLLPFCFVPLECSSSESPFSSNSSHGSCPVKRQCHMWLYMANILPTPTGVGHQ
jgi:hypothetical protein